MARCRMVAKNRERSTGTKVPFASIILAEAADFLGEFMGSCDGVGFGKSYGSELCDATCFAQGVGGTGVQNETGSEGELAEHVGPAVFGWFRGRGEDPELAHVMVYDGDGPTLGDTDGPTAAKEVDVLIGVEAAGEVECEVEVQEAGVGTRAHGIAVFG